MSYCLSKLKILLHQIWNMLLALHPEVTSTLQGHTLPRQTTPRAKDCHSTCHTHLININIPYGIYNSILLHYSSSPDILHPHSTFIIPLNRIPPTIIPKTTKKITSFHNSSDTHKFTSYDRSQWHSQWHLHLPPITNLPRRSSTNSRILKMSSNCNVPR